MSETTLTNEQHAAQAAKHGEWAVQAFTSKLQIMPVTAGLVESLANVIRRRPVEFPTAAIRKVSRQLRRLASDGGLSPADVALGKMRLERAGAPLDPRLSKNIDAATVDGFAADAVSSHEQKSGVTFDDEMRETAQDAVWSQLAEFFGALPLSRAEQISRAEGYLPVGETKVAGALRDIERSLVSDWKAHHTR